MKKNRILSAALFSVLLLGAVSCADDGNTPAADTDASTAASGSDTVQEDIFRPASFNAFGMDKEGQDYRACAAYGPMYKK